MFSLNEQFLAILRYWIQQSRFKSYKSNFLKGKTKEKCYFVLMTNKSKTEIRMIDWFYKFRIDWRLVLFCFRDTEC